MRRTSDYFIPDSRDDRETESDHLRFEIARVTEWAARHGGHPESAPALERTLLTVAELPTPQERNDDQPDLFASQGA